MHRHDDQAPTERGVARVRVLAMLLGASLCVALVYVTKFVKPKKTPAVLPVKRLTGPIAPVISGQTPGISLLVPCFVVRLDPKAQVAVDREKATAQLLAAVQKRIGGDPTHLLGSAKADPANAAVIVSVLRGAKPEQVEGLRKMLEPHPGYPVPVIVESAPEEKK